MTTKCPNCQIDLDVPTEYLGCKVECPDCGHKFIVGNQPTRVPPQQPKKKSGGKKIPKWVFIVIPAALLFSIAVGFIVPMILIGDKTPKVAETPQPSPGLKPPQSPIREWLTNLPDLGKGRTVQDFPLSQFTWHNNDPETFPQNASFYVGIRNLKNQIALKVFQCTSIDGFPAVFVQPDMHMLCTLADAMRRHTYSMKDRIENANFESDIVNARKCLAVIVRQRYAVGDDLKAGTYAYFGHYTYTTSGNASNTVLLFAETEDDPYLIEKRFAQLDAETQAQEDAKRPELATFLGIRFGDVVKDDDFDFEKDEFKNGLVYRFTPDKPFRKFDEYRVKVTPTTRKIFMIMADVSREAKRTFHNRNETDDLRTIVKAKYGVEENDDRRGWRYKFRNARDIYLDHDNLHFGATDRTLEDLAQKEWYKEKEAEKSAHNKTLQADIDSL